MNPKTNPATGIRNDRETTVRYEVHRECEDGRGGLPRPPVVEEFFGLDRARLAALGYALDGPAATGERFSGTVRIYQALCVGTAAGTRTLIDVIDERVAFRLLNETRLPRPGQLALSLEKLQAGIDELVVGG